MPKALPGEVWRVDFGIAAKVRPALILSDHPADNDLALVVVIPHTTAVRGSKWEVSISKLFLNAGVFHLQQIQPISLGKLDSKLGVLTTLEFQRLKREIVRLLDLNPPS